MTAKRSLLHGILFIAVASFPVSASSLASVSASAGSTSCSQSDPNTASCGVTVPVGSQTATASALANATWANGSGTLEATAFGSGLGTTAFASVNFSTPLIVTGVTGSGNVQIVFSGFQMNIVNNPGTASVSSLAITVGGASSTATLPNGAPQNFSVTVPVVFASPTAFSIAFSATASGTIFQGGIPAMNDADGIIRFPTFVVTDANGNVLSNASVQFVPEPASWLFIALGLTAMLVIHRMKVCRTIADNFSKRPF